MSNLAYVAAAAIGIAAGLILGLPLLLGELFVLVKLVKFFWAY